MSDNAAYGWHQVLLGPLNGRKRPYQERELIVDPTAGKLRFEHTYLTRGYDGPRNTIGYTFSRAGCVQGTHVNLQFTGGGSTTIPATRKRARLVKQYDVMVVLPDGVIFVKEEDVRDKHDKKRLKQVVTDICSSFSTV